MHMVRHAADAVAFAVIFPTDGGEVGVEIGTDVR